MENRVSLCSEGTENSANSESLGGKTSGCFITSQKRVCWCHLLPRPSSLSNLTMTDISLPFVECTFALLQPPLSHVLSIVLSIDCICNQPVVLSRHLLNSCIWISFDVVFVKRFASVIPNSLKGRMTCRTGEVLWIQLVNEIVLASGNEEEPRSLCPEIAGHLFSVSNGCWFSLRASAGQRRMGVVDLLTHHMISRSVRVREKLQLHKHFHAHTLVIPYCPNGRRP